MGKGKLDPSEELVKKVRTVAANLWHLASETTKAVREGRGVPPYFGRQLESFLREIGISVSMEPLPAGWLSRLSGEEGKAIHRVTEDGVVRLEFTYKATRSGPRLEAVRKYEPGDWERKIDLAYQKCLNLIDQVEIWAALSKQILSAKDPSRLVKPLEDVVSKEPSFGLAWLALAGAYQDAGRNEDAEKATATALSLARNDPEAEEVFLSFQVDIDEDSGGTIKRLEKMVNRDQNFALAWSFLGMAYMYTGRLKDAQRAASTAVSLAPDNPWCHFNLSTIYFVPLCNSKAPKPTPEESRRQFTAIMSGLRPERVEKLQRIDPSLFKEPDVDPRLAELTLEELGCSYGYARQMTEKHAREAMILSMDRRITEGAKERLETLKMMDEMYGKNGDKHGS